VLGIHSHRYLNVPITICVGNSVGEIRDVKRVWTSSIFSILACGNSLATPKT